jgi:hypothetical protein
MINKTREAVDDSSRLQRLDYALSLELDSILCRVHLKGSRFVNDNKSGAKLHGGVEGEQANSCLVDNKAVEGLENQRPMRQPCQI